MLLGLEVPEQVQGALREARHVFAARRIRRADFEDTSRLSSRAGDRNEPHASRESRAAVRVRPRYARLADTPGRVQIQSGRVREFQRVCSALIFFSHEVRVLYTVAYLLLVP